MISLSNPPFSRRVANIILPTGEDRASNPLNIYAATGHEFAHALYGKYGISKETRPRFGGAEDDETNGPPTIAEENKVRAELGFSLRQNPWQ